MGRSADISTDKKQIIINMINEKKLSLTEIAKNVGVSRTFVSLFKKKLSNHEDPLQSKRSNCKKLKKTTGRQDRTIINTIKFNRSLPLRQLNEILKSKGIDISTRTIRRRLKVGGFRSCQKINKFMLNDNMMARRLKWAKKYRNFSVEDWRKVRIFF
jgi:transposase